MRVRLVSLTFAVLLVIAFAGFSRADFSLEEIRAILADLAEQNQQCLISPQRLTAKKDMLAARADGSFKPVSPPDVSAPSNWVQNAGFEEYNPNTSATQSRWIWWGGWLWKGAYAFERAAGSDGKPCAAVRCRGEAGQAGIFTPPLPILKQGARYKATVRARAEGGAVLEMRFKADVEATGVGVADGAKKVSPGEAWAEFTLEGTAKPGAKSFRLYLYNDGPGSLFLGDVKLEGQEEQ